MTLTLHPNFQIKELYIGKEKTPLLVIDNFIEKADELVDIAEQLNFIQNPGFYPGLRVDAPQSYQDFFITQLQQKLITYFGLSNPSLKFKMCQYSLVTQPAEQLSILQRIPHFDSVESTGLACVHYLFKKDLGGTSFYRHRKTDFEFIDESRKIHYLKSLESENKGGNIPKRVDGYIYGDTPLFEHIGEQKGVFNRLIIYRRNSLHSGSIAKNFVPDTNPRTGRLSINSFIDSV